MKTAYIGIGSNLGDRLDNLKRSLEMLAAEREISVQSVSAIYETDPVGGPEQDPFLNACAALATTLSPTMLLLKMFEIEDKMGRVREERWGPRNIDLDLLIYEGVMMNTPILKLPHPLIAERNFVLVPMADINPDLLIPGIDITISKALSARRPAEEVKLFQPSSWYTIR